MHMRLLPVLAARHQLALSSMVHCRAQEQLGKLAEHKDNNVFKDLAALAAPALDRSTAASLSKSVSQVSCQLRGLLHSARCRG